MPLPAGTRLGPYEVLSPIGAGGMGEVYKAKDTRLDRVVAVKVLPAHLSSSEEIRQRFEREAKAISAISHPNICALHDVGREGETEYLVMEFLEGEPLSDRLSRGPVPIEQLLRWGVQIADALDRAHRQGIVHRDLKPANIIVTKAGIKLVDFGLARLVPARAGSDVSILPTQAGTNLTQQGMILGTFQYMSPEQLEGKDADPRSDIFALGAVLYEMATGRKAFAGASQASLIAAILGTQPPSMSSLAPMTPPALERVVRTCLEKDPDERWQSAHDVAGELKWIAEAGSQAGTPAPVLLRRKSRERLAWAIAAVLAVVSAAAIAGYVRRAPKPAPMTMTSILVPDKRFVNFLAISPDATRIAVAAAPPGARAQLWVRLLDEPTSRALPGTEGAELPFWSPDGRSIGFFADGKLKRIEVSGGPAVVLADAAPNGIGGTWNRTGTILFARPGLPISRIPESGGAPEPVTHLDASRGETTHRYPFFLPDGKHFLYLAANLAGGPNDRANRVRVASLDSKDDRDLAPVDSNTQYASGRVFFQRDLDLFALEFDPKTFRSRGSPIPVAEQVGRSQAYWNLGMFSVAEAGTIAYPVASNATSRLLWFDRTGRQIGTVGDPATFSQFNPLSLSPDGRRAAVAIRDTSTRKVDVWIRDLERGTQTRLTTGPGDNENPIWSPDGRRVLFTSDRKHQGDIYGKTGSGGAEDPVLEGEGQRITDDWSPDGRFVAVEFREPKGSRRVALSILDMSTGKLTPFHQRGVDGGDARFSPDGRWLAYSADDSGRMEVYVAAFPGAGSSAQVSTSGGFAPAWRRDGRELYYLSSDGKMMSVEIPPAGPSFEPGVPKVLFEPHPLPITYAATPDGQRFLVLSSGDEQSPPITLIQNWVPRPAR
jgi:Tol biopolymer transport system component